MIALYMFRLPGGVAVSLSGFACGVESRGECALGFVQPNKDIEEPHAGHTLATREPHLAFRAADER